MSVVLWTYACYVLISLGVTIWVAQTLHTNGRAFLVDAFEGREALADSVNHLLVVGFYLINLGYMSYVLKLAQRPLVAADAVEMLSAKIGLVLLALGAMHFLNIYIFSRFRRSALIERIAPPVDPDSYLEQSGCSSAGCGNV